MRRGFSPLDEQLALGAEGVSPQVAAWIVLVGMALPFRRAAQMLAQLTGVQVSASLVRRLTEAVGTTALAQAEAEVATLYRTVPPPPPGPERLVIGADGAMVPLLHGEWGEVKLVSSGVPDAHGHLHALSYFARLTDATTFGMQALGELHRRGIESAHHVAAVQDGAPWLQHFVDLHRPDALRILDWPHACDHLRGITETLFGPGTPQAQRAAARVRAWLWNEGPARVLRVLHAWQRVQPTLATAVAYFRDRGEHLQYPTFRAAGWPVGSGATESGHKQVMQARMKGAGMHWARGHVNPLLALTLLEANGRWPATHPGLLVAHHRRGQQQRRQRQQDRRAQRHTALAPSAPVLLAPPRVVSSAPLAPHPWRRSFLRPLPTKI